MNEEQYFSTTPIWFNPSDKLQVFSDKALMIIDGGSETEVHLHICMGDPSGSDSDKVCVEAQSNPIKNINAKWVDSDTGPLEPTTVLPPCKRFLTQDALKLILRDEDGELSLTLPRS